jgi:hypothetical protein
MSTYSYVCQVDPAHFRAVIWHFSASFLRSLKAVRRPDAIRSSAGAHRAIALFPLSTEPTTGLQTKTANFPWTDSTDWLSGRAETSVKCERISEARY